MTVDPVNHEVERMIRRSEIMAVVEAWRSGNVPHIGDTLDYSIDAKVPSRGRPYRFMVEQRHLDGARQVMSAEEGPDRTHHR
jgi:hypothetical protein